MTTQDQPEANNIETDKFIMGFDNYRSFNKLAKQFVGDSFVDRDEALNFVGEVQRLCDLAFRFCLGNQIDPDAIRVLGDMNSTRGFESVLPQNVADALNESFEPEG